MSKALAVSHGTFGRATLYQQDRDMANHAHREGHLLFYVAGLPATVCVDDQPHQLSPNQAVAINPWQPHNFLSGDPRDGSISLVLYIKPEWFLGLSRSMHHSLRFGETCIELTPVMIRLVNRITGLLLENAESELLEGALLELTDQSFDQSWRYASSGSRTKAPCASFRDFRIRKSIDVMKNRLNEGEGLLFDKIARDSGISRPHFFKLFRENVGVTPNIYLNTLRMEMAIDRLTLSSDPVTSIGLDLGFSSQASFTRFFASNVGIPPTNYRHVARISA